ncbi:hypothetical protein scyTo_0003758 [Scyliorhinus torazame]|uniref:EF-hand domain-containing protein n=1 Tax=Scyliorhinus torazame TaxID=75743 RepID=A0A401PNG7_SCYTO|nr:hypothetical protein [Scyliorhinus torazame]
MAATYVEEIEDKIRRKVLSKRIRISEYFGDYDKLHSDYITRSQFLRCLDQTVGIHFSQEEMNCLLNKYDVKCNGTVNYKHFINVIEKRSLGEINPEDDPDAMRCIETLMKQLSIHYKYHGTDILSPFRDLDKLNIGTLTDSQFHRAIIRPVGLTDEMVSVIGSHYAIPEKPGFINYLNFCNDILARIKALKTDRPNRPPIPYGYWPPEFRRGLYLTCGKEGILSEQDIQTLLKCFGTADCKVRYRDFCNNVTYRRLLTKTQFERGLDYLGLSVEPMDFKLLCKRFEDPVTGEINYVAFSQAVDKEYSGFTVDSVESEPPAEDTTPSQEQQLIGFTQPATADDNNVDLGELMSRMRHHILVNRVRTVDFIEDFDALHSGRIAIPVFRRTLSMIGFKPELSDAQFRALVECYEDPTMPDHVIWTNFTKDIDSVFTLPELEKKPNVNVPPLETYQLPKVGTVDADILDPTDRAQFESLICRLKERIIHRHLETYPVFRDFDRYKNNHVFRAQFRRCLSQLNLPATDEEMDLLEKVFSDELGFDYVRFLEQVDPPERPEKMYNKLMNEIHLLKESRKSLELEAATDINCILEKIKTKTYRKPVKIGDHMKDFDKLNSGRILKNNFRRALDLDGFELQPSEMAILEKAYESCGKPDSVDYKQFIAEIESIFTLEHLEKFPRAEVTQYKPPPDWELNVLSTEEITVLQKALARLAETVRIPGGI